jgi:DmsA/YnfE family anaerobic dimethyl sulfoxide reductase A subunit
MKRTGKRGEGEFERISWEEAIDTVVEKLRYTIDTYGNEAIYGYEFQWGFVPRLLNLIGGYLSSYGNYSLGQIMYASPYTFGGMPASPLIEALDADLLVLFGNSPSDTAMSGSSSTHDLARLRAAGVKVINIDYRLNESSAGYLEEWIPIRPGTDAALASALCYVFITEGFSDEEFLHSHCVGYDQETMPEGTPANASYKDYLLGTGYDMVPKSPEWAAPITQIPVDRIYELAREIGNAKAAYICQGWGPQRRSNGENTCRAITMVPIVSGHIGKPGTNTGNREASANPLTPGIMYGLPVGDNPVKARIPSYLWVDAVDDITKLTMQHDGIQGTEKLTTPIKFIWTYRSGWLLNCHGDINRTHSMLQDESKCEFILAIDTVMNACTNYADLILPDIYMNEYEAMASVNSFAYYGGMVFGQAVSQPKFENRAIYDVVTEIADRFGVKEQYTEGRTLEEWTRFIYEQSYESNPDIPLYDEGLAMGIFKQTLSSFSALAEFRNNPEEAPLETPSGKIEIYSSALADTAATWEFDNPVDVITPIPIYAPGFESYEETSEEFPLQLSGFHYKGRSNSSYANIDVLKQAFRQQVWINPVDADPLNIKTGDLTHVTSKRGIVEIEAKVTSRIIPGTIAIPQGAWHNADMAGDKVDKGGNINTLTHQHPTPLTKGNGQGSNIARIEKL